MKKLVLFTLIVALSCAKSTAQTVIGGVLSGNVTLNLSESPYHVTNNLLIQDDAVVTIEPGVNLLFDESIYLRVEGTLRAIGTASDPITFTSSGNTILWGGIYFADNSEDYVEGENAGCLMEYCNLSETGYFEDQLGKMIICHYSSPKFIHCDFQYSSMGIYADNSAAIVERCYFHGGSDFALWIKGFANNWGRAEYNEFFDGTGFVFTGVEIFFAHFNHNYMHDIGSFAALRIRDEAEVSDNTFEDGGDYAMAIFGGSQHTITCNTMSGFQSNILITCERHPLVENNNFLDHIEYNVYWEDYDPMVGNDGPCLLPEGSGNYATIDMANNFWGTTDTNEIEESIWDFNDDFSLKALINYAPYLQDPVNSTTSACSVADNVTDWINTDPSLSIFPVPANDDLVIRTAGNTISTIQIHDMLGRVCMVPGTLNTFGEYVASIENLASGNYIVTVHMANGHSVMRKFIKA